MNGTPRRFLDAQQPGAQAVVDVVGVVGDVVGDRRRLRLQAGMKCELEALARVVGEDRARERRVRASVAVGSPSAEHRAIVLDEAFQRLLA